jgi:hypothetical protein
MKHSILSIEQGQKGGIYLVQTGNKTLLSLRPIFELEIDFSALPNFNAKTLLRFYAGFSIDPFHAPIQ